jgi:hypothetical protein
VQDGVDVVGGGGDGIGRRRKGVQNRIGIVSDRGHEVGRKEDGLRSGRWDREICDLHD